jgi:hypothetical protein
MRFGDHNFRNRQLYEECHDNPYYQKKLELMEKREKERIKKETDKEIMIMAILVLCLMLPAFILAVMIKLF